MTSGYNIFKKNFIRTRDSILLNKFKNSSLYSLRKKTIDKGLNQSLHFTCITSLRGRKMLNVLVVHPAVAITASKLALKTRCHSNCGRSFMPNAETRKTTIESCDVNIQKDFTKNRPF